MMVNYIFDLVISIRVNYLRSIFLKCAAFCYDRSDKQQMIVWWRRFEGVF